MLRKIIFLALFAALALQVAAPAHAYEFSRTLQYGDHGRDVKALKIRVAGWYPSRGQKKFSLSSGFGTKTVTAVKAFQTHYGISADGVAGPETFAVLDRLEDADGSTSHFNYSEFKQNRNSSCSAKANAYAGTFGGGMVSPRRAKKNVRRVMWRLEALRAKAGDHAIGINSGFRSKAYNNCIGGAGLSQHLYGTAVDNRMAKVGNHKERYLARNTDFSGIGCYAQLTHNHFDIRLNNKALAEARFWWWPDRDRKDRDLDDNGRPCWGERNRVTTASADSSRSPAASGSLLPTEAEIELFERAGEWANLQRED